MKNFTRVFITFIFFSSQFVFSDPYGTLLGNFNNVNCYSNGTNGYVSNDYNTYNGTNTGMKWQCVEFVNRYYLQIYNLNIRVAGHNATDYFPNAAAHGLIPYSNINSISPQVGDLLCFQGNTYGHVAIVREVGTTYLKVAQQNVSNTSSDINYNVTMSVANGLYNVNGSSIGNGYTCQGWLRKPSGTINCNFTVNNGSNISGWIFWKYPPMPSNYYTVLLTITNLPIGNNWALYISNASGNIAQIAANQSGTSYSFPFNVSATDPLFPNGSNYKFRLTPQGQPNTIWCESSNFSISSLPTLSISMSPSQQNYTPGNSVNITWPISGGLGGNYGGLTGNIRLQYYKNDTALGNIITIPLTNNSYQWIVPTSIPGGMIPGCGYKIAGSVQDGNAPNGYVYAFSNSFCINSPLIITQESQLIPEKFELYQNFPNPFNPNTIINFDLPKESFVKLEIFDNSGSSIIELSKQVLKEGSYRIEWDATNFASGIYYYRIEAGDNILSKKMILLK